MYGAGYCHLVSISMVASLGGKGGGISRSPNWVCILRALVDNFCLWQKQEEVIMTKLMNCVITFYGQLIP